MISRNISPVLVIIFIFGITTSSAQLPQLNGMYFSENLQVGDTFQWKISNIRITYYDPDYSVSFGDYAEIKNGSIIKAEILKSPIDQNAVNPVDFNTSAYFAVTVDSQPEPQEHTIPPSIFLRFQSPFGGGIIALALISPTRYTFENGTQMSLPEFQSTDPNATGVLEGNTYTKRPLSPADTDEFITLDISTGVILKERVTIYYYRQNAFSIHYDLALLDALSNNSNPLLGFVSFSSMLIWITLPILAAIIRKKR